MKRNLLNLIVAAVSNSALLLAAAFTLSGLPAASKNAVVQVSPGVISRPITKSLLGYNTALALSNLTWNPKLSKIAAQFSPGMLRFPGGTVGQYWDWRLGGVSKTSPGSYADKRDAPRVWLSEFVNNGLGATGAEPVFVLNMLNSNVETQIAMLKEAQALGCNVRYAELGNEFYYAKAFSYKFNGGQAYADDAEAWAKAIKAVFPTIKLGVPVSTTDWSAGGWNQAVAGGVPDADAFIQHIYISPNITAGNVSAANIDSYLSSPGMNISNILQKTINLPASHPMEIWVTEYNCNDWSSEFNDEKSCWAHGLFVALMTQQLLETRQVSHMLVHQLVAKNSGHGAAFSDQYQATATGIVMQLFAWAMRDAKKASALSFTPNASLGSHKQLVGEFYTGAGGARAFLMNLSSSNIEVDTTLLFPLGAKFHQVSASIDKNILGSDSVTRTSGDATGSATLAPYSATLLVQK